MRSIEHSITSIPIALLFVPASLWSQANHVQNIMLVLVALVASVIADVDTTHSNAIWKNPIFLAAHKTIRIALCIASFLGAIYGLYLLLEGKPYINIFVASMALLIGMLIERKHPYITYYVMPSVLSIIMLLSMDIRLQFAGVLIILVVWSGHRTITHSLDFFVLLSFGIYFLTSETYHVAGIVFIVSYGTHLIMDILTGKLLVSYFLPLVTFNRIKRKYITLRVVRYDSIGATMIATAIMFISFYLLFAFRL